ncbi:MinD/ParA family protein [Dendrosporobacter sp. 1207_IL3150]|uniref:MinD/ParA family protein n=1 Tax=Dendrosporobacter sp. 1207_IL3150 TaxID=3084054 RepID=UPI002FDA8DB1
MADQAEKLRQLVQKSKVGEAAIITKPANKARVITVTSGKGGVGKTNFTVNLAISLAKLGQKVLIIDADLGTANVDVVLGRTSKYNLLNILEDGLAINEAVSEGPYGIKYLSGGSGIHHLANLTDSQLFSIISQISLFDDWADTILIDTGAGLNRNVLNFVIAADEVIIITTPEPTAITDAYAMMKAYINNNGTSPLKLVVNRVIEVGEGEMVTDKLVKAAFRFLGLSVIGIGFIYEDRNLIKAVKNQKPLLLAFPDTLASKCINNIAQNILFGNYAVPPRGIKGFFSRVFDFWRQ